VVFSMILTVAWFLNTLMSPAYFANLGTGELRWNTGGHVAIGVLNFLLGVSLGLLYGGIGVVLAWALALLIGSGFILFSYHIGHRIPFKEMLPEESRCLFLAGGIGLSGGLLFYYFYDGPLVSPLAGALCLLIHLTVTAPFCWFHPMKGRLVKWFMPTG
jgi:O-antigen/teichoic acid export membrane protein